MAENKPILGPRCARFPSENGNLTNGTRFTHIRGGGILGFVGGFFLGGGGVVGDFGGFVGDFGGFIGFSLGGGVGGIDGRSKSENAFHSEISF